MSKRKRSHRNMQGSSRIREEKKQNDVKNKASLGAIIRNHHGVIIPVVSTCGAFIATRLPFVIAVISQLSICILITIYGFLLFHNISIEEEMENATMTKEEEKCEK